MLQPASYLWYYDNDNNGLLTATELLLVRANIGQSVLRILMEESLRCAYGIFVKRRCGSIPPGLCGRVAGRYHKPVLRCFVTGTNNYQVNVGDTFMVQVNLSDITTPGGLGFLGADVVFDGAFLSGPTGDVVTPGSIVPDITGLSWWLIWRGPGRREIMTSFFVDMPLAR